MERSKPPTDGERDPKRQKPEQETAPNIRSYQNEEIVPYVRGEGFSYEVHEMRPNLPRHHEAFTKAQSLNEHRIRMHMDALEPLRNQSSEIESLSTTLHSLLTIEYGPPTKVALVGDAGTGKSTFLNCLLGKKGLALTVSYSDYS